MPEPDIKLVTKSPPEELEGLADYLRALAVEVEAGNVLGIAWATIGATSQLDVGWVKARGIDGLMMRGAVAHLEFVMHSRAASEDGLQAS